MDELAIDYVDILDINEMACYTMMKGWKIAENLKAANHWSFLANENLIWRYICLCARLAKN